MEIGDFVCGTVEAAESFGIYVKVDQQSVLVPFHELSWLRIRHSTDVVKVGQEVKILINGSFVREGKQCVLGSLRSACPEKNPWINMDGIDVGQTVSGEVCNIASYGVFIKLNNGLAGLLHKEEYDENGSDFQLGETVKVVVKVLSRESERIEFCLPVDRAIDL